jgi:hypothetical protein
VGRWVEHQQPTVLDTGHLGILHPDELDSLVSNQIILTEDAVIVGNNCKRKNKY